MQPEPEDRSDELASRSYNCRIFASVRSPEKANKVAKWAAARVSRVLTVRSVEVYHKGGYVITLRAELAPAPWDQAVVAVISDAQQLGYSWTITGDIQHGLDLWSTEPAFQGATAIHVVCQRAPLPPGS